ncbi:hypothetical protein nbrc107697_20570 [Gordonia crocea]|uniref:Uncharacterized protein n=1 Tax=Gordonia crocea TaxID=589162 RepID=A0A7I9UXX5_9ACTN|nr:hypothetical protein nbrc107697_20570 [Gordonia crocea]
MVHHDHFDRLARVQVLIAAIPGCLLAGGGAAVLALVSGFEAWPVVLASALVALLFMTVAIVTMASRPIPNTAIQALCLAMVVVALGVPLLATTVTHVDLGQALAFNVMLLPMVIFTFTGAVRRRR